MATEARQREGLPTGFLSEGPSRDGDLRWYAIHVPEGREDAVASKCRQLLGSDLVEDCFVPKYERYMKREGAWRIVVHPMFSEYVFVSTRDVRALAKALGQLSFPAPLVGRRGRTYAPLSPSVQAWLESVSTRRTCCARARAASRAASCRWSGARCAAARAACARSTATSGWPTSASTKGARATACCRPR